MAGMAGMAGTVAKGTMAPVAESRPGVRPGRLLRVAGRCAHVLEVGRGPPVLLLHGLGGLAQEILAPLEPLADRFRLVALDRPGYGHTDALPAHAMAPHRQARWLVAALDRLGLDRPLVVAHSLGAATALCLALDHPGRVAGLVLIGPFVRPTRPAAAPLLRLAVAPVVGPPLRTHVLPRLAALIAGPRLAQIFAPDPVPAAFRDFPAALAAQPSAVQAMADELRGFNESMMPRALRLRRLGLPTVVVAGAGDRVAPPERHARWLVRRLPRARLVLLRKVGHMPHHVRPDAVARAIAAVAKTLRLTGQGY